MSEAWIGYACFIVGIASVLVAGVFQAFSDFVMKSLAAARPACGAEAMQLINKKVFQSLFLPMLLGLAPVSIVLAVVARLALPDQHISLITAGAVIYTVFVLLVTMLGNVPMNNRLAVMKIGLSETADYWRTYSVAWTRWNHVRALGALAAGLCFVFAGASLS